MPLLAAVDGIVMVARIGHTRDLAATAARAAARRGPPVRRCWELSSTAHPRKDIEGYGFSSGAGGPAAGDASSSADERVRGTAARMWAKGIRTCSTGAGASCSRSAPAQRSRWRSHWRSAWRYRSPISCSSLGLIAGGLGVVALVGSDRYPRHAHARRALPRAARGAGEARQRRPRRGLGHPRHPDLRGRASGRCFACWSNGNRSSYRRCRRGRSPTPRWSLVEAFNPSTHGILKILGGFRQQLEWIPFFFFGYVVMRSKAPLPRSSS